MEYIENIVNYKVKITLSTQLVAHSIQLSDLRYITVQNFKS